MIYETPDHGESFFFSYINQSGEQIAKINAAEVMGQNLTDALPGIKNTPLLQTLRQVYETGEPVLEKLFLYEDDIRSMWVENSVYKLPTGEIVAVYTDITQRKMIQDALSRRDAILEAITYSSQMFLKTLNWEDSIASVIAKLGEAAEVSRAYLFKFSSQNMNASVASKVLEWIDPTIQENLANFGLNQINFTELPIRNWYTSLIKDEIIFGRSQEFSHAECKWLLSKSIHSIVLAPIFSSESLWGFIGFDECKVER
ncbi:PAS domain-containing protein, partial [bacterium]|nr:PAS domain-containing protein [bacterium]